MWTPQQASRLRSAIDQDFLQEERNARPQLGGTTLEEAAMQAKVVEGWEMYQTFLRSRAEFTGEQNQQSSFVDTSKL